jgi:hypothetical protein
MNQIYYIKEREREMKTIIQGFNITTIYSVENNKKVVSDNNEEKKIVYFKKPKLKYDLKYEDETIAEVNENIELNRSTCWGELKDTNEINLNEEETVSIKQKIYRLDLNAIVYKTNKILSKKDVNKEESEKDLAIELKAFNKQMIESEERLLAYCNLHKLNLEDTDVNELFKLVYPNGTYDIEDGKLIVTNNDKFSVWHNSIRSSLLDDEYMNATLLTTPTAINAR